MQGRYGTIFDSRANDFQESGSTWLLKFHRDYQDLAILSSNMDSIDAKTDFSFRHHRSVFVWLLNGFRGVGRGMELESIAQIRLEPRFKPDLHEHCLVGKIILASKMANSQNALVEKPDGPILHQTQDVNMEPDQ